MNSPYLLTYQRLLDDLKSFSNLTNSRLIVDVPEEYFINNANFFTKSLMVLICAYLESYLKDISMHIINHYNSILEINPIPESLIKWSFHSNKDTKERGNVISALKIKIDRKDVDEYISGSPYRTEFLFNKLGIELAKCEGFNSTKDKINSIVVKRNKIVHHNDDASDISLSDINQNIEIIKTYIKIVDNEIITKIY